MRAVLASHIRNGTVRAIDNLYTFDIMPDVNQTKGECAKDIYTRLGKGKKSMVPVYIGDSTTDEDAFKAFKTGVTIRVGQKAGSAARYYFRNRPFVDEFLATLEKSLLKV